MRGTAATTTTLLVLVLASLPQAQGTPPPTPLTVITPGGRRPVPTTLLSGQELIALDDLAALFQVAVREDTLAGAFTISYRGRTVVASPTQPMASVNGRVVTLPSPLVRVGQRWFAPIEFLPRALAPIYDQRIELRRAARLLIVGDARVPRVAARIDAPGPPTRAVIEIAPAAPATIDVDASRVLVRIDADALEVALPSGSSGLIEQIRAGDQPNTVAVMLAPAASQARAVASTADNVTRVTIEVPAATPAESAAPPRPAAPSPDRPVLPRARAALEIIAIDPGHGGEDVGVRGGGGTEEKQVTLDIARRLRSRLETRLGVRVILTRDDDLAMNLDQRAAVANNSKADLFLSLHANAALAPEVAGAAVLYLGLDREGEEARREAAAETMTLPVLGGGTRRIDVLQWDLAQVPHVGSSAIFAAAIEQELRQRVPMGPYPLQQGPLRVLTGANMPAALVEIAYLTNRNQERLARSDDYQNTVADALFDAIVRFQRYLEDRRGQ